MTTARITFNVFELTLETLRWRLEQMRTMGLIGLQSVLWRLEVDWPFERGEIAAPSSRAPTAKAITLAPDPRSRPRRDRARIKPQGGLRRRVLRLSPVAVAAVLLLLTPYWAPNSLTDHYVRQHALTRAIEIEDAGGRWLGVMPRSMIATRAPDGAAPSYVAIETHVPQGFLDVLIALEDENIGSWRSGYGLDVFSLLRAAPTFLRGGEGPGGSSLTMMLVRSMRGIDPAAEGTRIQQLRRKVMEVFDGALLYHRLGGIRGSEFPQYLARHIVLAQGTSDDGMGTPLHGIALTSRVLWGVPPERLSLARQALLASAVRRPIVLAPDGRAASIATRNARWGIVVDRAIRGVELAYPDDPVARAAVAELRRMPPPRPYLDRELEFSGRDAGQRYRLAANPERRVNALALPETIAARGEMMNRFGADFASRITALRLSIDLADNLRFRRRVDMHLRAAEHALAGRLTARLTSSEDRPATADVVVAVVREGRVVRLFSNSLEPLFNGSNLERHDGRYDMERAVRPVGSVAKVMIAVLAGREDRPDTRYCNARVAGGAIRNADGQAGGDCSAARDWRAAEHVFAQSLNLPLTWRLRHTPDWELRAMAARFRLALPEGVAPRIALSAGSARATPSDLLAMIQGVSRGAQGRLAIAAEPSLVTAYRTARSARWTPMSVDPAAIDLRQDFTPRVTSFVRTVLSAPLRPGGTLSLLADEAPGAVIHIAKSGTSEAGMSDRARDKYALGAFRIGTVDYAYIVLVSARDPNAGIGRNIGWRPLYPLLRETIASR